MARINYISADGAIETLDLRNGTSVMQGAVSNGIEGIDGECGGSAMCATCHVYVDEKDLARLPLIGDVENEMLDSTAAERRANSRLSCQIEFMSDLDGLTVHLPESQY